MDQKIPTLAFPPEIRDGQFLMVPQDSDYDKEGSVEVVARCPQGHIDSLPEMGMPDYVLTRGTPSVDEIRDGIRPYEPRVDLTATSVLRDMVATITLDPRGGNGGS